jgi:hypothetical protein
VTYETRLTGTLTLSFYPSTGDEMSVSQEHRVSMLAHRFGLRLICSIDNAPERGYQLVEPMSMSPVYPGGAHERGSSLEDLDDWLQLPWE